MKTYVGLLALIAVVSASPMLSGGAFSNSFWKGTKVEGIVKNLQTDCNDRNDALSCMKFKALHFLDQVLNQESIQVSENLEIVQNGEGSQRVSKSEKADMDILDHLETYIKSHDVIAKLPGTTLTLSPRNLDKDEMTLQMKFSTDEREGKAVQGEEGRKSKLKKIIVPVLVFVLLKAMTLIPLAIGVLGLKAWNALQLSFFSFVVSLALAIFQLCKKLASDHTSAQVAAHGPWDNYQAAHYAARAFPEQVVEDAQDIAYNAYSKS